LRQSGVDGLAEAVSVAIGEVARHGGSWEHSKMARLTKTTGANLLL
jgi:hypothetical protein